MAPATQPRASTGLRAMRGITGRRCCLASLTLTMGAGHLGLAIPQVYGVAGVTGVAAALVSKAVAAAGGENPSRQRLSGPQWLKK